MRLVPDGMNSIQLSLLIEQGSLSFGIVNVPISLFNEGFRFLNVLFQFFLVAGIVVVVFLFSIVKYL